MSLKRPFHFSLLLSLLLFPALLQGQIIPDWDKPEDFKKVVFGVRPSFGGTGNGIFIGASFILEAQNMKHSAFFIDIDLLPFAADSYVNIPSSENYNSPSIGIHTAYTHFFTRRVKTITKSTVTGYYYSTSYSADVTSKRRIEHGLRLGWSYNGFPKYSQEGPPNDVLSVLTDQNGNNINYTRGLKTYATAGLVTLGWQRRVIRHHKFTAQPSPFEGRKESHFRSKALDYYAGISYAYQIAYADVIDYPGLIDAQSPESSYQIRSEENTNSKLGWFLGMRIQNHVFHHVGLSTTLEIGCRYAAGGNVFSTQHVENCYARLAVGVLFVKQPK